MDKSDFDKKQKEKGVEYIVPQPLEADLQPPAPESKQDFERQYASLLLSLRTVRQPVSVIPSFIPRNFLEQIQIYENGATYRLYIYMNGTWRYTTLT